MYEYIYEKNWEHTSVCVHITCVNPHEYEMHTHTNSIRMLVIWEIIMETTTKPLFLSAFIYYIFENKMQRCTMAIIRPVVPTVDLYFCTHLWTESPIWAIAFCKQSSPLHNLSTLSSIQAKLVRQGEFKRPP